MQFGLLPLALRKRFAFGASTAQARLKKIEPAQIDAMPMTRVWLFSLFVSIRVAGFIIGKAVVASPRCLPCAKQKCRALRRAAPRGARILAAT